MKELSEIRSAGGAKPETSYYGLLEQFLNEIGRNLKPRVRSVSQVADTGAGSPDFGLYSAEWDRTDTEGQSLASGVYFTRFMVGGGSATRKMLLVK
jgi:hypothetical protein